MKIKYITTKDDDEKIINMINAPENNNIITAFCKENISDNMSIDLNNIIYNADTNYMFFDANFKIYHILTIDEVNKIKSFMLSDQQHTKINKMTIFKTDTII